MTATVTTSRLRQLGTMVRRGLVRTLVWFGLVEEPSSDAAGRLAPTLLRSTGWLLSALGVGITLSLGANIAFDAGPAFFEGRLGGFANASPSHVAEVVEGDSFASVGKAVTSLGVVHNAYSPAAETFSVRVEGYHVRLDEVAMLCGTSTVVMFKPSSDTVAYVRRAPWPCHTLLVGLVRTDSGDAILARISLDGRPLPGRVVDSSGSEQAGSFSVHPPGLEPGTH